MKISKIFIPGDFEDAFLYMGRLVILTADKSLYFVDMDFLGLRLSISLPDMVPLASMLFSRNDWISGGQFEHFVHNEEIADVIKKTLKMFPEPFYQLHLEELQISSLELNTQYDFCFDFHIYNGRAYLATDKGLFDLDIDWGKGDPTINGETQKRIDARCIAATARYGALNVSCGPDGLFSCMDDFGIAANDADRPELR